MNIFRISYKKIIVFCLITNVIVSISGCSLKNSRNDTVLTGKRLSILGDSISTYNGYSNNSTETNSTIGNNEYFYSNNYGGLSVEDTWWKQLTDNTGMNLLVNNSWSGSTVSGDDISSGDGTRAENLHDDTGSDSGMEPDIIIIYMGINDYNQGVSVDVFKRSYFDMLSKIKSKYSAANIFCLTLPQEYLNNDAADLVMYNSAISQVCEESEVLCIDLANESWISDNYKNYLLSDGLHPGKLGMDLITTVVQFDLFEFYN